MYVALLPFDIIGTVASVFQHGFGSTRTLSRITRVASGPAPSGSTTTTGDDGHAPRILMHKSQPEGESRLI